MNLGRISLLIGISLACYGLRLYQPLPEGITSPVQSAVFIAVMKICDDLSAASSFFGLSTPLNTTRVLLESSSKFLNSFGQDSLKIEDTFIEGVRVRTYTPEEPRKFGPGIVYIHGGGWVMCNLEVHDPVLRELARTLRVFILSIDYRLSPEHPFPIPFEDSLKVVRHFLTKARYFNVSPKSVVIMGDSAGGNLAAAVSLKLRDEEFSPMPNLQVLIYPLLQAFDLNLPSYLSNDGTTYGSKLWVAEFLAQYFGIDLKYAVDITENKHITSEVRRNFRHLMDVALLPSEYRENHPLLLPRVKKELAHQVEHIITNPYFSPLVAKNLTGYPHTYVVTAEFDVLRDDGFLFTDRLKKAKVPVQHQHYSDSFHGIFTLIKHPLKIDGGVQMLTDIQLFLKRRYKLRN